MRFQLRGIEEERQHALDLALQLRRHQNLELGFTALQRHAMRRNELIGMLRRDATATAMQTRRYYFALWREWRVTFSRNKRLVHGAVSSWNNAVVQRAWNVIKYATLDQSRAVSLVTSGLGSFIHQRQRLGWSSWVDFARTVAHNTRVIKWGARAYLRVERVAEPWGWHPYL